MRMEDFSNAITDFETALGVSDLIDCPNIETPVIYLIMLNKTYENYYDCLKKLFKDLFKMEDLSESELYHLVRANRLKGITVIKLLTPSFIGKKLTSSK